MTNKSYLPRFPACADEAPTGNKFTKYDRDHFRLYLCLRFWFSDGATREELYEHIFYIDHKAEPERARRMFDSHLRRANWLYSPEGLKHLFPEDPPQRHPQKSVGTSMTDGAKAPVRSKKRAR